MSERQNGLNCWTRQLLNWGLVAAVPRLFAVLLAAIRVSNRWIHRIRSSRATRSPMARHPPHRRLCLRRWAPRSTLPMARTLTTWKSVWLVCAVRLMLCFCTARRVIGAVAIRAPSASGWSLDGVRFADPKLATSFESLMFNRCP